MTNPNMENNYLSRIAESPIAENRWSRVHPLIRNIFYSFITQIMPVLVSFILIPQIIIRMGDERFGILSIAWIFLGYFTLFDLGLGRATTKFVSEYLANKSHKNIPKLIATTWLLLLFLGCLGLITMILITPILVEKYLGVPDFLQTEVQNVLYLVAFSIPIVIYTTGVRAVLEAYQKFRTIAFITTPSSVLNYLLPFIALFFTSRLDIIVFLLLINRLIFLLIYLIIVLKLIPGLLHLKQFNLSLIKPVIGFGGWVTVSNIIGPLMSYMDRFLVGFLISIVAVTYYVTPYEMLRRLHVVPSSLIIVLFPTFSKLQISNLDQATNLYHRTIKSLIIIILPIIITIIVFAHDILRLWINESFADQSAKIMQWMAFGLLINYPAQIAYQWIQASGFARFTASLHLIELPIFWGLIYFFSARYGLLGFAIAGVIRITIDAIGLFGFSHRLLPPQQRSYKYLFSISILAIVFYISLKTPYELITEPFLIICVYLFALFIYVLVVWRWFLHPSDKEKLLSFLRMK